MKFEQVPIESLILDPENARLHPERNLSSIRESLEMFGQQLPLVVGRDNHVIVGNGRLEVMRELGWTTVWIHRSELTGAQATAFAIADNRTAELATWNWENLAKQFEAFKSSGITLESIGWEKHEYAPLMSADWSPIKIPDELDAGCRIVYVLTVENKVTIDAAIAQAKNDHGSDEIEDGAALVLIAKEYLARHAGTEKELDVK